MRHGSSVNGSSSRLFSEDNWKSRNVVDEYSTRKEERILVVKTKTEEMIVED